MQRMADTVAKVPDQARVDIATGTPTVRGWTAGGVGVIELNRAERRNALHEDMYDTVPRLIDGFEADDSVRCMLVTGAGSAFCAGGGVQAGAEDQARGGALPRLVGG